MTSGPSTSPRLLKGAIIVLEAHTLGAPFSLITFQYNPQSLRRSFMQRTGATSQQGAGGSGGQARRETMRTEGPPRESISMSIELDAADQLDEPGRHPTVALTGLHPALAALEMLVTPPLEDMRALDARAAAGEVQLNPSELPLVLLVWGPHRVAPVSVTNLQITEEAFGPDLDPIRAKVDLTLNVLNHVDLPPGSVGRDIYLAYIAQKEVLAASFTVSNAVDAVRGLLPF